MSEIIIPNPVVDSATAELRVQRRMTEAFINRRPEIIVLTPRAKVQKPAGGFVWEDQEPREPQTLTFIESSGLAGSPLPTVTVDGVVREVEFELLGPWDAALALHDAFTHQGKPWEVTGVFYDNGYETRAMVSGRG